jgi:hypothetical protein
MQSSLAGLEGWNIACDPSLGAAALGCISSEVLIQFSNSLTVIARSEATKQSIAQRKERMDCFAPLAMTLI